MRPQEQEVLLSAGGRCELSECVGTRWVAQGMGPWSRESGVGLPGAGASRGMPGETNLSREQVALGSLDFVLTLGQDKHPERVKACIRVGQGFWPLRSGGWGHKLGNPYAPCGQPGSRREGVSIFIIWIPAEFQTRISSCWDPSLHCEFPGC